MGATQAQIKMLQYQRRQHGMDEETYRAMLHEASNGRTTSTKELTQEEAFRLIDKLVRQTSNDVACDRMRKKIIGMARELGWLTTEGKADMERVNNWCCRYGFGKKKLNFYSEKELPKLVSQFEYGPYKSHLSKI